MTDSDPPLKRLFDQIASVGPDAKPEEIADATGLDVWEPSPTSPADTSDRVAFRDGVSDAAVRYVSHDGSLLPPPNYPVGWPFVPDTDVVVGVATVGNEELVTLMWPDVEDEAEVVAQLRAAMTEEGWHEHPAEAPSVGSQTEILTWFHRATAWRVVSRIHTAEISALSFGEWRGDLWRRDMQSHAE